MKIVQGLGLALALAIGTAGCVQTADADPAPPTPTVPNLGLPLPGETTTTAPPEPFRAEDADFSALFPDGQEPERKTDTIPMLGWHVPVTSYGVFGPNDDWALIVGFVDYGRIEGSDVSPEVLDAALNGAGESFGGTVTSSSPIELVGAVGLDGVIEGDGVIMHLRLIGVGNRMWMIESLVGFGASNIADEYETLLQTFQVL